MPEKVSLLIDGDRWTEWEQVGLQLSLDSFSTATFTGPFDPQRDDMRRTYRPFSYRDLVLEVGEGRDAKRLFTGTLVGVVPKSSPDSISIEASGYSLPGVLDDSNPLPTSFPLQCNGLTLKQVADKLCDPLGVSVELEGDGGAAFRKLKSEPTDKVWSFLADVARQRGKILTSTEEGVLRIANTPDASTLPIVANLREGEAPMMSCTPTFSPQAYYSEITGLAPTKPGRRGAKHTQQNLRASGIVRPLTFKADDTDRGDLPGAVGAKMARMFGNMVSYVVEVPTWRNADGGLWKPGQKVSLYAPGAMIFRPYEFLVRDAMLDHDAESEKAALGIVLPNAFRADAQPPALLPWD